MCKEPQKDKLHRQNRHNKLTLQEQKFTEISIFQQNLQNVTDKIIQHIVFDFILNLIGYNWNLLEYFGQNGNCFEDHFWWTRSFPVPQLLMPFQPSLLHSSLVTSDSKLVSPPLPSKVHELAFGAQRSPPQADLFIQHRHQVHLHHPQLYLCLRVAVGQKYKKKRIFNSL